MPVWASGVGRLNLGGRMSDFNKQFYLGGYLGVPDAVASEFYDSLTDHIRFVQEAGRMLGVDPELLRVHDLSKFTVNEWAGYAMHFKGGGAPDLFARAWLNHIHENPHHWQHWIFPDGFTPKGSDVENGCVEMPIKYATEMIADWMGASMAYTGSWDMTSWLWNNIPKIRVHSRTAEYLRETLDALGYADVVNGMDFAKSEKPHKVEVAHIAGRYVLTVNDYVAAVEGDVCRDMHFGKVWDAADLKQVATG